VKTAFFALVVGIAAAAAPAGSAADKPAPAPGFQDALLDKLTGSWVMRGTIVGKQTTQDVTGGWVLGHQYLHLHEISREKVAGGAPVYEAEVYVGYDKTASQYVCVWLDIFGGISTESIGHALRGSKDTIAFRFAESADAGVFHTTFLYDRRHEAWNWVMDSEANQKLEAFARVRLTRQ
jgi:hypothetical protein